MQETKTNLLHEDEPDEHLGHTKLVDVVRDVTEKGCPMKLTIRQILVPRTFMPILFIFM
jgi:hypothetical protein